MEAKSVTKYLKISPRKMRLVIDTIRYKSVPAAFSILSALKKRAARMVEKALKSAAANAAVKKMDEGRLFVRQIKADGGPSLKRTMPRSMGRADVILKRMTHLTVVVSEREGVAIPSKPEAKESKGASPKPQKQKPKTKRALAGAR